MHWDIFQTGSWANTKLFLSDAEFPPFPLVGQSSTLVSGLIFYSFLHPSSSQPLYSFVHVTCEWEDLVMVWELCGMKRGKTYQKITVGLLSSSQLRQRNKHSHHIASEKPFNQIISLIAPNLNFLWDEQSHCLSFRRILLKVGIP